MTFQNGNFPLFFQELHPECLDEVDKKLLRDAHTPQSNAARQAGTKWKPKYGGKWKFLNGTLLMGVLLGVILVHPRTKLLQKLVGTFQLVSRRG